MKDIEVQSKKLESCVKVQYFLEATSESEA